MDLKEQLLEVVAKSILTGGNEAGIDFGIKALSLIVCKTKNITEEKIPLIEKEIRWIIEEKLKEITKEGEKNNG